MDLAHVNAWRETYVGIVPDAYLNSLSIEKRRAVWAKMLTERQGGLFTFVAVHDNDIVGFIDGGVPQQPEHGAQSELAAIYLLKKFQGTGVGRKLFEIFLIKIKTHEFADMYLWVLRKCSNTF